MTLKLFKYFGLIVLLCSCSDRVRNNPFDPANPRTGGAPEGIKLSSYRNTIDFTWNLIDVDGMQGYHIYRSIGHNSLSAYLTVEHPTNSIIDQNIIYDSLYSYAIQGFTTGDEGTWSDPVTLIPGPFDIWICDYYNLTLKHLSYDINSTVNSIYLSSPVALSVDANRNQVIVADYWNQRMYLFDRELELKTVVELGHQPVAMDRDLTSGEIYILLEDSLGLIHIYDDTGVLNDSISFPVPVDINTPLGYDRRTNSIWLGGENAVYQYRLQGQVGYTIHGGLTGCSDLEIDPLEGGCWAVVDSGIVRITSHGVQHRIKWDFITQDIGVNRINGDCYYTGRGIGNAGWETGYITVGDYSDSNLLGDEYPNLRYIEPIPHVGRNGFIVHQVYTWQLLRFDRNGTLIGEQNSVGSRIDIDFE